MLEPYWTIGGVSKRKPAGVFSPKLSRILPPKGAVSTSPAWLKKFEPTVIQNPMTLRRFFIIVIEKYLGKESNSKRCLPIKTHICRSLLGFTLAVSRTLTLQGSPAFEISRSLFAVRLKDKLT
ncbi:hypothetical protein AVEN_199174-1 [Araneus ventricosus]|uniref:Uncharacterized protein n=1 Tax=Araneus ventricosus TaxID=182803 RepID=A0A4Y2W640_ARAVE|nr:hypothetical protein AVEN_199174-1 [Araneus ventricosus]